MADVFVIGMTVPHLLLALLIKSCVLMALVKTHKINVRINMNVKLVMVHLCFVVQTEAVALLVTSVRLLRRVQ